MADATHNVLDGRVAYLLKRAQAAVRHALDDALRPLELTVPQYSCLELLREQPGLSNADLARESFVSRQSMNSVIQLLQSRGLITRPPTAPTGRSMPTRLTPAGRQLVDRASSAMDAVETQMLAGFSDVKRRRLHADLIACVQAFEGGRADPTPRR